MFTYIVADVIQLIVFPSDQENLPQKKGLMYTAAAGCIYLGHCRALIKEVTLWDPFKGGRVKPSVVTLHQDG